MLKVEMNAPPKKPEKITEYPCLGQGVYGGLVVLFYKESCGMVVAPQGSHTLGKHSTTWAMDSFVPFEGELKLSNG